MPVAPNASDAGEARPVAGPAIVTESTATTVLPPGSTLTVDAFGTLVVAVGKEA